MADHPHRAARRSADPGRDRRQPARADRERAGALQAAARADRAAPAVDPDADVHVQSRQGRRCGPRRAYRSRAPRRRRQAARSTASARPRRPSSSPRLAEAGGGHCVFNPSWGRRYLLRNHQKLIVIDDSDRADRRRQYRCDLSRRPQRQALARPVAATRRAGGGAAQRAISTRCSAGRNGAGRSFARSSA